MYIYMIINLYTYIILLINYSYKCNNNYIYTSVVIRYQFIYIYI